MTEPMSQYPKPRKTKKTKKAEPMPHYLAWGQYFLFLFFLASRGKTKKNIIPARDPKQCCGVFLLEIVDAKSVSGSVHQNPVVLLLQDVFVRISASAASRATCARSLYEDLLCKMSESGRLYEEPLGPLVQELCMRISCACAWFLHLCKIGV